MAKEQEAVKEIADINTNFSQWYTDVVIKTKLVDYGPVKGTMVIRPYGYAIWENIQKELDQRFKDTGHENAYFPLLIPYSFLTKEAEHVEGFAPEVAVVTHAGGEELAESLVVRPTSEAIICHMYSKWVQSYRDLPLLINQWANVVRWEKTTRPFLRTSEFLWQEGHTLHATAEEAQDETIMILKLYQEFAKNVLAMPVIAGKKTQKEKFAGAIDTYSIEAMMKDGKSLQSGTTHYFGTNFTKAFDIKFQAEDKTLKYAYQSSWGVSTRLIGALIMAHGDERGLALPPKVAPIQAVIIPIAVQKAGVMDKAKELFDKLKDLKVRVKLDDTDERPGWKFNEYELKGVPLRIELGPKDLEKGIATLSRRDKVGEKFTVPLDELVDKVPQILNDIQQNMYNKALEMLNSRTTTAYNMEQLKEAVEGGKFALSMWCGEQACEDKIKEELAASSRNMPFDKSPIADSCVCCQKPAKYKIYFAKAY